MHIPNADRAVIDPAKLRDYLLSTTHTVGRFKAAFFCGRLGYPASDWLRLDKDLRVQHLSQPARAGESSAFGQRYEIRATLVGPSGASALVVSAWIVKAGDDFPTFVTAYPGREP